MVGQHHPLSGREFEQTPGDGEGLGSLACYSPQSRRESDTTQQLINNNKTKTLKVKHYDVSTFFERFSKKKKKEKQDGDE